MVETLQRVSLAKASIGRVGGSAFNTLYQRVTRGERGQNDGNVLRNRTRGSTRLIADLPGHYPGRFARKGFPNGELIALMVELGNNALTHLLDPLRKRQSPTVEAALQPTSHFSLCTILGTCTREAPAISACFAIVHLLAPLRSIGSLFAHTVYDGYQA